MSEDIQDILFGSEALQILTDKITGEILVEGMTRSEDGILEKLSPNFVGSIWFDRTVVTSYFRHYLLRRGRVSVK